MRAFADHLSEDDECLVLAHTVVAGHRHLEEALMETRLPASELSHEAAFLFVACIEFAVLLEQM